MSQKVESEEQESKFLRSEPFIRSCSCQVSIREQVIAVMLRPGAQNPEEPALKYTSP